MAVEFQDYYKTLRVDRKASQDEIQKAFQHYLGTEVLRIARQTGRPVKDLCDRAERTLYDWKRGQPPTNVT